MFQEFRNPIRQIGGQGFKNPSSVFYTCDGRGTGSGHPNQHRDSPSPGGDRPHYHTSMARGDNDPDPARHFLERQSEIAVEGLAPSLQKQVNPIWWLACILLCPSQP